MVFYMLCKYLQHVVGRFLRITFSCALLGALSTIPVPGAFEEWRRFPRDYQPRPASSSPDSLSLVPTDSCHRPVETIPYRCPAGYRRFCLLKASHLICTKTGNVASRPNSHYAPRRCASRTQVTLSVHSSLLRDSSESQGRTRTCTHGICTRVRWRECKCLPSQCCLEEVVTEAVQGKSDLLLRLVVLYVMSAGHKEFHLRYGKNNDSKNIGITIPILLMVLLRQRIII